MHLQSRFILGIFWSLILTGVGLADSGSLRYFDCPTVSYFEPACTDALPQEPTPPEAPQQLAPSSEEPLFTPATVSPDTPPLMLQLLQEPTEANARAYFLWYLKRLERAKEVQALLNKLAAEYQVTQADATDREK